jgi:hypothetical protein
MAETTHRCPVGDCPKQVPRARLMCGRHWQLVPAALKRAIRRAWRGGAGAGTRQHRQAMSACIRAATSACQPAANPQLRRMARTFLAGYRHPNQIAGETWDEEDVSRLIDMMRCHPHRPDPRTRRCRRCGATLTA